MKSSRRIYLNTTDEQSSDSSNHADTTFDISKALITATNNEKISLSLCQVQIPVETTYINNTGIDYILQFTTDQSPTATGLSLPGANVFIAFTDGILQPPFIVNNTVACAVPFFYSSDIKGLVQVMNQCLEARQLDSAPLTVSLGISEQNTLVCNSAFGKITFQNSYWDSSSTVNSNFKKESQKVARLLGINYKGDLPATTVITQVDMNLVNRSPDLIYPISKDNDSILISTNQNTDSFSSSTNNSSIISSVPVKLGTTTEFFTLTRVVESTSPILSEDTLKEFRDGFIYHQNKNVFDSHKTISGKNLNNLRLTLKDSNNNTVFCNKNIFYELEVIIYE